MPDAIAKSDRQSADSVYNNLLKEFSKNPGLAEAVYAISAEFQYKMWDAARANKGHKFVADNSPGITYGL